MNDRFRFRAYWYNDVFNEWMVYENPELITGDGTCRVFDNSESGADEWRENVILCQCTGLKDKNGKLIYESDILINSRLKYLFVVKWDNSTAQFDPCVVKGIHPVHGLYSSFTHFPYEFYEVIGNIYENEELLNI